MRRTALGSSVLAALLLLPGCAAVQRTAWQLGLPVSAPFQVDSVRQRVGYLDARLSSAGIQRRIFARADDPACRAMLLEGQTVDWSHSEPFGPLWQGGAHCAVAGLGDLEQWRKAKGRASTTTNPITSSQTRYRIVHRDEQYLYAQGGFSIAGLLNWSPGTDQVIALLPRTKVCAAADRDGFASVEFRIAGRPAMAVVTPEGLCPVEALIPAPRLEPKPDGPE